jgi:hypothetical protein
MWFRRPGRLPAALISTVFFLAVAAPAQGTFNGGIGKIAYQAHDGSDNEIWTINENGTGATPLTNNSFADEQPAWSPDGKKIAFHTNRDGNLEIYTMNPDGSSPTRITNNASFDEYPSWSPDGTKILFDSGRDDPHSEIYTMNADGTGVTRLTNDPGYDYGAVWSPDGTKIAWSSTRNGNQYDVFVMNANGSGITDLTPNRPSYNDVEPDWSPDGTKIAYAVHDFSGSPSSNVVMTSTGTELVGDQGSASTLAPSWRPDGNKIAFTLGTGNSGALYESDPDFTHRQNIGPFGDDRRYPDWQPLNSAYPRPRGATPLRIPLIPAMKQCTTATTAHRGSISNPSCFSPQPESAYLTVGSPEYNGVGANSQGSFLMSVRSTPPEDALITVSLSDVRCRGTTGSCANGPLSDYSGNLLFYAPFRITDKNNGLIGNGLSANGTVQDLPLVVYVPCVTTGAANVGSTCSVSTSLDSVFGNTAVEDGRRALWQMAGLIEVDDGGPDGLANTFDNNVFAVGGVFIP